jgi:hypothetical protein
MCVELKIKQKHLALEPAIIKHEEGKLQQRIRENVKAEKPYLGLQMKLEDLVKHRRWDVRNEARATHLARAMIHGMPYTAVESKRRPENEYAFKTFIVPRIVAMVNKYGATPQQRKASKEDILAWTQI